LLRTVNFSHKRLESGLREMSVKRKSLTYACFSHDDKGYAVYKPPFFVFVCPV
jgi:hypothetical protein